MRRLTSVPLLVLLAMAGCDGAAAPPPGSAAPTGAVAQLRASFPPRGLADTIEIDAVERLPLQSAALIAPDGSVIPAGYVNSVANPGGAAGQWSATHPWQDAVTGNNSLAALTSPRPQAGAALHAEGQLLATVSTADIALPDPVAYRRDWQHYRIRVTFGVPPGDVETRDIAAPEPPPGG